MDEQVRPKVKRAPAVRLEKLGADLVRKLARQSGIDAPYLLREAVQLLQAKYAAKP